MEQANDNRFSQIALRLEQTGYSLNPSQKAGLWLVTRDGHPICWVNGEKLVYDDNVYADAYTQSWFSEVLQLVHSI